MNVVLLDRRIHVEIDSRRNLERIYEVQGARLQQIPASTEDQVAPGKIHPSEHTWLGRRPSDSQVRRTLEAQLAACKVQVIRRYEIHVEMQILGKSTWRGRTAGRAAHTSQDVS